MVLRTIDVSGNQGLLNIAPIDCDAVIVKATGGDNFVNDCCDYVVQQCFKLNKPTGIYHFAHEYGNINDPAKECDYFISNCSNYFGKVLVALDYEIAINGHNYTQQDVEWCKAFIQHFIQKTGIIPLLYISKSLISACDWTPVTSLNVGGWIAQYATNTSTGWTLDPWTDNKPFTPFNLVLQQFSGHGRINGYNGDLDLSIFFGDRNTWNKYAQPVNKATQSQTQVSHTEKSDNVTPNEYLTAFAKDVLSGKYGNGNARKDNIYNAVQNKVNELTK